MYDQDWREKPNAAAWKSLIYDEWWNDFDVNTSAEGTYQGRGFYGEYSVRVTLGDTTRRFDFSVLPDTENNFSFSFQQ